MTLELGLDDNASSSTGRVPEYLVDEEGEKTWAQVAVDNDFVCVFFSFPFFEPFFSLQGMERWDNVINPVHVLFIYIQFIHMRNM